MAMIAGTAYCIKSFRCSPYPTLWVSFVLSYYIPISFTGCKGTYFRQKVRYLKMFRTFVPKLSEI